MSDRPRFVFDASVIVSALLFENSIPGVALYGGLHHGTLLSSRETIEELNNSLSRKKFDRYLTPEERELFLQGFIRDAALIELTSKFQVCRDSDDDKYLALAVDGHAVCIVSGDEDLLVLTSFETIPILTPAQFVEFLTRLRPE